ncbi:hypothetical protein ACEQPO_10505 [Bacillus sp. SL00103]
MKLLLKEINKKSKTSMLKVLSQAQVTKNEKEWGIETLSSDDFQLKKPAFMSFMRIMKMRKQGSVLHWPCGS